MPTDFLAPKQDLRGYALAEATPVEPTQSYAPAEVTPVSGYSAAEAVPTTAKDLDGSDLATFYGGNQEHIQADPELRKQVLDAYRKQLRSGIKLPSAAKLGEAAVGAGKSIAGAAETLGGSLWFNFTHPLAQLRLAAKKNWGASGTPLTSEETEAERRLGEVVSGVTGAAGSTVSLARSAARNIANSPALAALQKVNPMTAGGRLFDPQAALKKVLGDPATMTDDELETNLQEDAAIKETLSMAARGEALPDWTGLDVASLAKDGVVLDAKNIASWQLVADPLNLVPLARGAFAVNAGNKTLATVASKASAESLLQKLVRVGDASATVSGKALSAVGRGVAKVNKVLKEEAGGIHGLGTGATIKAIGAVADLGGRALTALGSGRSVSALDAVLASPTVAGSAARIVFPAVEGALQGAAVSVPLIAGADTPDEASGILAGGAVFGAAGGVAAGLPGVPRELVLQSVRKRFEGFDAAPLASFDYGTDATLDQAHSRQLAVLNRQDPKAANRLNHLRAVLRPAGKEAYLLPPDVFSAQVAARESAAGRTPRAGYDAAGYVDGDKVFLNSDATALGHEVGHLVSSMMTPEVRADFLQTLRDTYTSEQIEAFGEHYDRALGEARMAGDEAAILDEVAAEVLSKVVNSEGLGTVKPTVLKAAADFLGRGLETLGVYRPGIVAPGASNSATPLGVEPSFRASKAGQKAIADLGLLEKSAASVEALRTAPSADPLSAKPRRPANLRVTPEQQAALDKVATGLGIPEAAQGLMSNLGYKKTHADVFERVNTALARNQGEVTPLVFDYESVKPSGAGSDAKTRRQEQAAAYVAEAVGKLPDDVRVLVDKVSVPYRWTTRTGADGRGNVNLLVMSLDKVIANADTVNKRVIGRNAADALPYAVNADGGFAPEAARQFVADLEIYTRNQANGFAGDGSRVVRPADYQGVIPPENPTFRPVALPKEHADYVNLVMGLAPPKTTKGSKSKPVVPNLEARKLAEANQRPVVPSRTAEPGKDVYTRTGQPIGETNPLRDRLAERGVDVSEAGLNKVTEELNLENIRAVEGRPESGFRAPVTDLVRAGFMPAVTEAGKELERRGFRVQRVTSGQPGGFFLEAIKDGNTEAVLDFSLPPRPDGVAQINSIEVEKPFRNQGIGEALYRELGAHLQRAGIRHVGGEVHSQIPVRLREKVFGAAGHQFSDDLRALPKKAAMARLPAAPLGEPGNDGRSLVWMRSRVAARKSFMPDTARSDGSDAVREIAEEYSQARGLTAKPFRGYAEVNERLASRLADAYQAAEHSPDNPEVKAAYAALAAEVRAQWDAIRKAGYTLEPWQGEGEPYRSSAEMRADVAENKHLWYLPTDGNFGSGSDKSHPMLGPSGVGDAPVNDLFRAVHDFFGHAKEGYEFGPRGEYNAYLAHARMFSAGALPALASETLAQNSWVNYGSHLRRSDGTLPVKGDPDFIPPVSRPFADQKAVVLDPALVREAAGSFMPTMAEYEARRKARAKPSSDASPEPFVPGKAQLAVRPPLPASAGDTELRLVHYSSGPATGSGTKLLDPARFGKGAATPTDLRGLSKRYYFVEGAKPGADEPLTVRPAYGVRVHGGGIYDLTKNDDPLNWLGTVNRQKADQTLIDAGYTGLRVKSYGRDVVALFKAATGVPLGVSAKPLKKVVVPKDAPKFMPSADPGAVMAAAVRDADGTPFSMGLDFDRRLPAAVKYVSPDGGTSFLPKTAGLPGFYSKLEGVLDEKFTGSSMPVEHLKGLVNGAGVKAEELKWSGLPQLMEGKERVTRQEVVETLDANRVRLVEVVKQDVVDPTTLSKWTTEIDPSWSDPTGEGRKAFFVRREDGALVGNFVGQDRQAVLDTAQFSVGRRDRTKFGRHALPGGTNYREVLLTLPAKRLTDVYEVRQKGRDKSKFSVWDTNRGFWMLNGMLFDKSKAASLAKKFNAEDRSTDRQSFVSEHWSEPDVLAHARLDDRTDSSGAKVLFVEEVQSDWHQKGRSEGYEPPPFTAPERGVALDRIDELNRGLTRLANGAGAADDWRPAYAELMAERDALVRKVTGVAGVPDAPFRHTWQDLVMKRVLREAAEKGYDRVAWTTGPQQADRYDLSKHISRVSLQKTEGDHNYLMAFDKSGKKVLDQMVKPGEVADYVGTEVAAKLEAQEWRPYNYELPSGRETTGTHKMLTGLELKVGGEGMSGFYDDILPRAVAKYVRPWGAKVGKTGVGTVFEVVQGGSVQGGSVQKTTESRAVAEAFAADRPGATVRPAGGVEVHSVDITPEMRRSILEKGQPLFMPKTGSGRAMEEKGYGFEHDRFPSTGMFGVTVRDVAEDRKVGYISATQTAPDSAIIALINVVPGYQGQGIGEALYRELGAALQEAGVTEVKGTIVGGEGVLRLREKVFGPSIEVRRRRGNAIDTVSTIASDASFMPRQRPKEDRAALAQTVKSGTLPQDKDDDRYAANPKK